MADKHQVIRISIPSYVSYTLGMAFRNQFAEVDPRILEYLKMKQTPVPPMTKTYTTVDIMDLIDGEDEEGEGEGYDS